MCEEYGEQKSACLVISIVYFLIMAVLSLLTMIFAIIPKNSDDDYPDYFKANDTILDRYYIDNVDYQIYLVDIEFGENINKYNNYGYTGIPERKCYLGHCYNKRELTSLNCSEVCAISGDICEVENQTCNIYCEKEYNNYYDTTACHYYNEIAFWRGQKMNLTRDLFYFSVFDDTVLFNESCKEGFKQCGYLNQENDKLCIDEAENCPINKVIIKDDNTTPTDFEYECRQIGDKYLFFTNQNINHSLYINIIADSEINSTNYTEIIDSQPLKDFLTENPYIYDGNYTSKSAEELSIYGDAKLKMKENINQKSLTELRKLQEIYIEMKNLYSEQKVKEMNEVVARYLRMLFGFNIANFVYMFIAVVITSKIFCPESGAVITDPMKSVLTLYLILIPVIFFNIYSFILVILNKNNYDQYYALAHVHDLIYCDYVSTYHSSDDDYSPIPDHEYGYYTEEYVCFFDKINFYNNALFICYIIANIITILYPIIMASIYVKCPKSNKNGDKNQKLNPSSNFETPGNSNKSGKGIEMITATSL